MTTLHFKAFDQAHTVFIEKIMNQQEIHAYLSDIDDFHPSLRPGWRDLRLSKLLQE